MTPQQANELLRAALKKIIETRFGYDGDCGVKSIAEQALDATDDCAPAPTEPAVDRDARNAQRAIADIRRFVNESSDKNLGMWIDDDIDTLTTYLATPASPAVPDRDHLLKIIAFAYQIAGWHDAPEHILDVLAHPESATAAQVDAMLPYQVGGGRAVPGHSKFGSSELQKMIISQAMQQVAQASQPTSAEELQQKEHIPPAGDK